MYYPLTDFKVHLLCTHKKVFRINMYRVKKKKKRVMQVIYNYIV